MTAFEYFIQSLICTFGKNCWTFFRKNLAFSKEKCYFYYR